MHAKIDLFNILFEKIDIGLIPVGTTCPTKRYHGRTMVEPWFEGMVQPYGIPWLTIVNLNHTVLP